MGWFLDDPRKKVFWVDGECLADTDDIPQADVSATSFNVSVVRAWHLDFDCCLLLRVSEFRAQSGQICPESSMRWALGFRRSRGRSGHLTSIVTCIIGV
jgi:hypothetical protein